MSSGSTNDGFVSLYKAPQRGQARNQAENGYKAEDFPGGPDDPYANGKAYFGKGTSTIADIYAKHYGEGVIEIRIPSEDYASYFAPYEQLYQGGPLIEVAIPNTALERLNAYERIWTEPEPR